MPNLEFISGLRLTGPIENLTISMVVQENNFREMADFVRLGKRLGVDVVYFSRLVDWGTFEDAELRRRQVHGREHPYHAELIEVLGNEIFRDEIVFLGNLTELVPTGLTG